MAVQGDEQESALVEPRLDFGAALREFRISAGIRQKDLGRSLGWSLSKISMIERGERTADEEFARGADRVLGADGALTAAWRDATMYAARLPAWFHRWVEVEQEAHTLRTWEPLIVPGLLQTEEYARAIFSGRPRNTSAQIEASVSARMERQLILDRENAPTLRVILDEGVLKRSLGSREVMAGQMTHLIAMAERPHVTVHVLPQDSWLSTGLLGAFTLASSPRMPDMAYAEAATQGQISADPDRVAEVTARFETLHGDALSQRASLDLIRETEQQWKK
ncbi:helix-turn-helix transcriptional regulator [Nonomuraea sp. NPDC046570]|uniref:helix-turn-helix domain-containing protein n=1 Tax=Nonomuraea sp. NPDC046570 TaxID=3155255 RepID=UPI0033CDF6E4